ncbi:cytochrome bd quinol oxidase subunit 2 apoprotein [Sulfobacillus acidophilus DSM 10332]|uniref:Cytochrome bd quinol oxidase subunit 2 apoprotein n=1 Tax=Sulfobacillus acidophilus (strain ATCC 700253 / DSM 10332 / NAL) TaxID=679936 RepID=G8TS99_SULAD|nr:cytochrome bd quinol oxidase subunit 2 apoprotein [Sulfobacillus acidophilus DSM 10332]
MSLPVLWYVLIAVLFTGYLVLEGFDYGVGILLPWVGHSDTERRAVLATIGPVWDANEVWLITAGGAMFAAFPLWYASLFSAFYGGLALLLVSLIVRGVALEFRSQDRHPTWRRRWDYLIAGSSAVPPLVWGLAMGNVLHGIPLNAQGNFTGSLATILNPYALVGAAAALSLLTLHGALYLTLKAPIPVSDRAYRAAFRVGPVATVFYFAFVLMSYFDAHFIHRLGVDPGPIPILAGLGMVTVRLLLPRRNHPWAFWMGLLTIILSTASVFLALYPDLMISSLNPAWSLTVPNAAANPYSLKVMTIVAITVLPLVLAYQAWTYWIFRRRISLNETFHY